MKWGSFEIDAGLLLVGIMFGTIAIAIIAIAAVNIFG